MRSSIATVLVLATALVASVAPAAADELAVPVEDAAEVEGIRRVVVATRTPDAYRPEVPERDG